jgi:hypothetical protein
MSFHAESDPSAESWALATELQLENPFLTLAFAKARASLGAQPILIGLVSGAKWSVVCLGFRTDGRLNRLLEIPSALGHGAPSEFWAGLKDFCLSQGITELQLDTFASPAGSVPGIGLEVGRHSRREFLIDLSRFAGASSLSSNHKRNIKIAQREQLLLRRSSAEDACKLHTELVQVALDRLRARGEAVFGKVPLKAVEALVNHGAGELFQVFRGQQCLASALILKSRGGGYYHSAGTTDSAREVGAAHFLVLEAAKLLKVDGMRVFNLGGSDDPGLERFKAGFGAEPIESEAAAFYLGSPVRHVISRLARNFVALLL